MIAAEAMLRLYEELHELTKKRDKLDDFLSDSSRSSHLDRTMLDLLLLQQDCMKAYITILALRIHLNEDAIEEALAATD